MTLRSATESLQRHRMPLRKLAAACAAALALGASPAAHATYADRGTLSMLIQRLDRGFDNHADDLADMIDHFVEQIRISAEMIVAALEKRTGVQNQLQQSELNYEARLMMTQRGAEAIDKFAAPSSEPVRACETSATSSAATSAANDSRRNGKAVAAAFGRKVMHTEFSARAAEEVMRDYNENYCTLDDQRRGRCDTVAPAHLQGANLSAGTLLAPNGGDTYSPQELEAARSYINMATNPVPYEMLPVASERTPAGQRYLFEQMQSQAFLSGATHSLSQLMASRTANSSFSNTAAGPHDRISLIGLMKKFVADKFGSQDYVVQLQGRDTNGLLREIVMSMAARNWMDYHTYLQNERIEANLALTTALMARERADTHLAAARDQAVKTRK